MNTSWLDDYVKCDTADTISCESDLEVKTRKTVYKVFETDLEKVVVREWQLFQANVYFHK